MQAGERGELALLRLVNANGTVRALILSGGGARGAYEAGVVAALADAGMRFDIVCGTSVGAVNGMGVAQGMASRLDDFWKEAADARLLAYRPEIAALFGLYDTLRELAQRAHLGERLAEGFDILRGLPALHELPELTRLLGFLDRSHLRHVVERYANVSELQSALLIAATNLTTADATMFVRFPPGFAQTACAADVPARDDVEPITEANYVDAVCASMAIPAAFEPVVIACKDGREHAFVDGAFTNNTPLAPAIDAGATEIVAISLQPFVSESAQRPVRHLRDVITLALEASTAHMLRQDRRMLDMINARVADGTAPDARPIVFHEIAPHEPLQVEPLDFTVPEKIAALLQRGRRDGERALESQFR